MSNIQFLLNIQILSLARVRYDLMLFFILYLAKIFLNSYYIQNTRHVVKMKVKPTDFKNHIMFFSDSKLVAKQRK